jgi:galactokinase
VLSYVIGEILFKQAYPEFASRITRLRDISCEHLGFPLARLYDMLKAVPLQVTRDEISRYRNELPQEEAQKLTNVLTALPADDRPLDVRGVVMFGLAECARSEQCVEYLSRGDAEGFGRLWYDSHDGDRVVSHDEQLTPIPWSYAVDDVALESLVSALGSPLAQETAEAQLLRQPGTYGCSTPEVDRIVDLARRVPGVKGAQLAGAGLGGCVMILVEDAAAEAVRASLQNDGFEARQYEFVEGAGLVVL